MQVPKTAMCFCVQASSTAFNPGVASAARPLQLTALEAAAKGLPQDVQCKYTQHFKKLLVRLLYPRAENRMTADVMERLIWLRDAAKDTLKENPCHIRSAKFTSAQLTTKGV